MSSSPTTPAEPTDGEHDLDPDELRDLDERIGQLDERLVELRERDRELRDHELTIDAQLSALASDVALAESALNRALEQFDFLQENDASPVEQGDAMKAVSRARSRVTEIEADVAQKQAHLESNQKRLVQERAALEEEISRLSTALADARQHRNLLREQRSAQIHREVQNLAPLVEAQREAVGESAVADLASEYKARADEHRRQWKAWGAATIGCLVAVIAAIILLFEFHGAPEGASAARIASTVGMNLGILGILVYAARLSSLQFKTQRHMEEVAENKAAALATFNRLAAATAEPEVRTALVSVLAQSVFTSSETGLLSDGAGDHITVVERLVAPAIARPSG